MVCASTQLVLARWARYVAGQDLTGFDRERIDRTGTEYLARAVEEAGA